MTMALVVSFNSSARSATVSSGIEIELGMWPISYVAFGRTSTTITASFSRRFFNVSIWVRLARSLLSVRHCAVTGITVVIASISRLSKVCCLMG